MEFMRSLRTRIDLAKIWQLSRQMIVLIIGALLASLGYALFLVPFNIAAGGVSGISIIINSFTGWPFGLLFLVLNIPLLALGFYYLGRWRFLGRTVVAVLIFSFAADFFIANLPKWLDQYPLTDDVLLSAIYGGIIGGIGSGLIYRSGGTMAGTGIVGRIWQRKTGVPLSQTYLYTNGIIILTAGLVFGWEIALYSLLTLFLNGVASDYTLEGPSSVRTVTIITDRPKEMGLALIEGLNRSVSRWEITGMYTGRNHDMLICTVYRPQVAALKRIVADVDQEAFVVIGTAHQAWGYGFSRLKDAVAD
jgi:uncharacterized membrane-anchored protein YitT (DUF2179 family)